MANFPRYDGHLYIDAYNADIVNDVAIGARLTVGTTLGIGTNATIGGTLGVTGATTLSSTLGVTGATTLSNTLGVTGATTLSSTLAAGATTITGLLDGTGDITRTGDMTLTNTTTGAGGITVTSSDASGDSKLDLTTVGGTFQIFQNQDGNTTLSNSDGIITIGAGGTLNGTTLWLGASTNTTSVRGIELTTTGQSGTNVTAGTVKVNPNAANVDFSVSGDTVADLISVDAGNDTFTLKAQTLPSSPSTGTLAIDSGASNTLKFYNGSAWVDTAGGAGTSWQTTAKTADFTAVAGEGYFVNTNGGAVTMTLPASPSGGDEVKVVDYGGDFNTNNLTITSASENIRGTSSDFTASLDREGISLVYSDATQGWQVFSYAKEEAITEAASDFMAATGGTITTDGDYKVHTFNSSGNFQITNAGTGAGSNTFDVLVIGGGGGGGAGLQSVTNGAGGGAGGITYKTGVSAAAVTWVATVGAGGAGGAGSSGNTGTNSTFSYGGTTYTGNGGGYGATGNNVAGGTGGSGGGGAGGGNNGAAGSSNGSNMLAANNACVRYYTLDQASGNFTDATGTNDAVATGSITYSATGVGNLGTAVEVNGSGNGEGETSYNLTNTNQVHSTYQWVKADTTGNWRRIWSTNVFAFQQGGSSPYTDKWRFQSYQGGSTMDAYGGTVTSDWTCLVTTSNGSTGTVYQDGTSVGTGSISAASASGVQNIHLLQRDTGGEQFSGRLDEWALFDNYTLSATEVTNLYNGGNPIQYTSRYPFHAPTNQGNDGEAGINASPYTGGGGGGAGPQADSVGGGLGTGFGGTGATIDITGSNVQYGGGGAGNGNTGAPGNGGAGGGGDAVVNQPGDPGTANTGGGGGGGYNTGNLPGGAGGSGVIIVRYKFQ